MIKSFRDVWNLEVSPFCVKRLRVFLLALWVLCLVYTVLWISVQTRVSRGDSPLLTLFRRRMSWNMSWCFVVAVCVEHQSTHVSTKHPQSHKKDSQPLNTEWSYLKIPYISERLNHKITNIFRKEGIPVRVAHKSYTLSELSPTTPRSVHAPGTIAPSLTPKYAY